MKKLNLSNVNAGGGFNAPKAGGYVCGVVDIIEKEEYELFEVYLDIIEGEFKGYYTKAIKEGHRKQLQKFTIFYKDQEKLGTLMGFLTSVKESNTGFNFDAKAVTSETVLSTKGKKVGIVFRDEEYLNGNGEVKSALKPLFARSVEKIKSNDFEIPARKVLAQTTETKPTSAFELGAKKSAPTSEPDPFGLGESASEVNFMEIPDGINEDLPFN